MKLYDLEIVVIDGLHDIAKFQLTLEATTINLWSPGATDEGEWSAPDIAAFFFGDSNGYWSVYEFGDGLKNINLHLDPMPNAFSHLWRDIPKSVAWLDDILKLPLFIGETGGGNIIGAAGIEKFQLLRWKVINRGF